MVRSKIAEVHLEVKVFSEPFACAEEQCNCGCGELAHLDEFDDGELEAMDDWLRHPSKQIRPELKSPIVIERLQLQAFVPRDANEGCVRVTSFKVDDKLSGDYMAAPGACTDRKVYKNESGAVIFYSDGRWRVNAGGDADSWVAASLDESSTDARTPSGTVRFSLIVLVSSVPLKFH